MLGLRGFPSVQGGVEKHAEELCPLLARMGCEVEVIVRSSYVPQERGNNWRGVHYIRIWAPKSPALETVVHSFLGVLVAGWRRPDILHVQAIGPALIVPLARLFGLRVVVTHHGADYDREKWGSLAKFVLHAGEAFGMCLSHRRIAISRTISRFVRDKYHVNCKIIPNGFTRPESPNTAAALDRYGLQVGRYVLMVGRLVPEKRQCDLIAAFRMANLHGWKLVLVGGSTCETPYVAQLTQLAASTAGVVMTGVQTGVPLAELFSHAGLFVLPSSHEGMPIALMEAMSYGVPVLASDIPAHRELQLEDVQYFPLGDVRTLAIRLETFVSIPWPIKARQSSRQPALQWKDWETVARQTVASYRVATLPLHGFYRLRRFHVSRPAPQPIGMADLHVR
jgi:glycosyltransferase involved in cell wall biosynthesis